LTFFNLGIPILSGNPKPLNLGVSKQQKLRALGLGKNGTKSPVSRIGGSKITENINTTATL